MIDIIKETLIDSLKLLPFLFFAFFLIEVIEHKLSKRTLKLVSNSNKLGPLIGSMLGVIPQCGFSVMATNLYITKIITLGTLISVYLSTSDEMLPILISNKADINIIIELLLIKVVVGIVSGFIIDFITRGKDKKTKLNYEICDEDHCHCNNGILKSSVKHTLNTLLFIAIITFILNIILEYLGHDYISKIFLKDSLFAPFITSLIGLIPNCGASVMLTELYLNGAISFAGIISGLLTGSGIALLVLFKSNKNIKENIKILLLVYFIGVISGIIIKLASII